MSFSQDGSRLLIGWPGESWDSCDDVAVYEWQSGSSTYSRIGEILPKLGSRVIHSASLSGDGNVVALGDGDDYSGSESVWTARVFHYSGGSWQQVGSDIVGPLTEGARNVKVSISSDGKVLSVGNSESDPSDYNATLTGRVRIYQWPSNDLAAADTWTQMGETIEAFGGRPRGRLMMCLINAMSIWMRVRCPATAPALPCSVMTVMWAPVTSTSGNHRRGPWSETGYTSVGKHHFRTTEPSWRASMDHHIKNWALEHGAGFLRHIRATRCLSQVMVLVSQVEKLMIILTPVLS